MPSVGDLKFACPYCGAFAQQNWYRLHGSVVRMRPGDPNALAGYAMYPAQRFVLSPAASSAPTRGIDPGNASECKACGGVSLWLAGNVIWPHSNGSPAEPCHPDMPAALVADYAEAAGIVQKSPRGAAALLRLLVQKLCVELGQLGDNINDDIGALVKAGLDAKIQRALDSIRVIGNEAVHPGVMDLRDDLPTALSLFRLVNLIVQRMISDPKHIDAVYESLPPSKIAGIEKRDR